MITNYQLCLPPPRRCFFSAEPDSQAIYRLSDIQLLELGEAVDNAQRYMLERDFDLAEYKATEKLERIIDDWKKWRWENSVRDKLAEQEERKRKARQRALLRSHGLGNSKTHRTKECAA